MPLWLSSILAVLAVLIMLYLFIVVVQLIAAVILRRQYAPTRRQIETAQRDVSSARKRLDQLEPFITSGSRDLPFGPLYDQARDLIAKATRSASDALKQLSAISEEHITAEPDVSAFRLMPMSREIMRRFGMRQGARNAAVYLSALSESMARINQVQADIAALPGREKEALAGIKRRAQTLTAALELEARPRQPLVPARQTLKQATANISQAERLLNTDAPTEAAVVAAYPLRLTSDDELSALEGMLADVKHRRMQAESALTKIREQLDVHKNEINTEIQGGFPRPAFTAAATTLTKHIDEISAKVDGGDYDAASTLIQEKQGHIASQAAALTALRTERARIIGMADKAQRQLATIDQWISETPPQFVLDRTQAAKAELEQAEHELRALVPREDVGEMATASVLGTRADDSFRKASTIRAEFETMRTNLGEITNLANERSVPAMVAQTHQASDALAQVNTAYWGDISPARLTAAADALEGVWASERGTLIKIVESELTIVLARLQPVREAFISAGSLQADAMRAVQFAEDDKAQAGSILSGEGITSVLGEIDSLGTSSPTLAPNAHTIHDRIQTLRAALAQAKGDYKLILAEARQARQAADAFLIDYHEQLKQALDDLDKWQHQLRAQRDALVQVDADASVAFTPLAQPVAAKLDTWLQAASVTVTRAMTAKVPLDDIKGEVAQAMILQHKASEMLKQAADMNRYVGDKKQAAKTALAELNGVLTSAQVGLTTLGPLETDARSGSVAESTAMLAAARQPMTEALELLNRLEQPANPLPPGDALTAADRMLMLIGTARAQADTAHAEIARQVNETRQPPPLAAQ